MKDIEKRLYELNARISLYFVTGYKNPTQKDMVFINREIGEIIKQIRENNEINNNNKNP